jgi:hypothetical protein
MRYNRIFPALTGMAMWALFVSIASAQTDSTTKPAAPPGSTTKPAEPPPGSTTKPADPPAPAPGGPVQLDDTSFPQMLKELGYKVEAKTNTQNHAYWVIQTQLDGWGYVVEVMPQRNKETKQIKGFWLISDLGGSLNNPSSVSAPALLKLMEKSHEMAPFFFTYNPATKHIAMNFEYPSGTASKDGLKAQFETLFGKIRSTYPLWKSDVLVAGGGFVPVNPNPVPVNPVPVNPPPAAAGLAGSQWVGSETLQGYAQLTFQFGQGNNATMIDNDGVTKGSYTQVGNQVTLSFYNGQVSYKGTINGNNITGTGQNAAKSWTFTLTRK